MTLDEILAAVRSAAPECWFSLFRWMRGTGSWFLVTSPDAPMTKIETSHMPAIAAALGGWPAATKEQQNLELRYEPA